jgi:glyceraldehyde-3-phosphate dehydrogenase type I
MTPYRIGINGLGRIGRATLKQALDDEDLTVVGVNDLDDPDGLAYLLRYDSVYGRDDRFGMAGSGGLSADGDSIPMFREAKPADIPWRSVGAEIVIESTGAFRGRSDASGHFDAGARYVLLSADSTDADIVVVPGVNDDALDLARHRFISMASCTTNALAAALQALDESFGIETAYFTTVHAYTSSQSVVDKAVRHRRRGRAAAINIIPTTTGAAKAVIKVLPHLEGRVTGMAMRVPVPTGSVVDLVARVGRDVSVEEVNDAFRRAAAKPAIGPVIGVTDDEYVSQDIVGDPHSGVVDAESTGVLAGRTVKVLIWYDNEWGYSARLVDLARHLGDRMTQEG